MIWAQERTDKTLTGVHPVLAGRVRLVLAAMAAIGYPMVATNGLRTEEEQWALYQRGRDGRPGAIVTNADGCDKRSNHQTKADGYGHAVDCAFIDPSNPAKPSWEDDLPWEAYGALARAVGLRWGIKLNANTVDRPHVELPYQPPLPVVQDQKA